MLMNNKTVSIEGLKKKSSNNTKHNSNNTSVIISKQHTPTNKNNENRNTVNFHFNTEKIPSKIPKT
jgi:hypothetical protein